MKADRELEKAMKVATERLAQKADLNRMAESAVLAGPRPTDPDTFEELGLPDDMYSNDWMDRISRVLAERGMTDGHARAKEIERLMNNARLNLRSQGKSFSGSDLDTDY